MVNINAFIAALKTTWLRKIITDNNSPWSIILQFMTNTKIFSICGSILPGKVTRESHKQISEWYRFCIVKI